jgi:hypothetical protein
MCAEEAEYSIYIGRIFNPAFPYTVCTGQFLKVCGGQYFHILQKFKRPQYFLGNFA